jgi:HAD superfamily hydrolase (TIGR01509 family)
MDLLIFDFDGLILDTETVIFEAWNEIFGSFGQNLPLSEWASCIGTSHQAFDVFSYLEGKTGRPADRKELGDRHRRMILERLETMGPRPGVIEYIKEAQRQRIALALASSSHQKWVMDHLSRLNLAECFHSIRTAEDVTKVKPDPELYELTLTFMGVSPGRALAFEDSPNGVAAARAAGIYCVAVPNSVTKNLPLDHADERLESMEDLGLRELLHRVEAKRSRL